MNRKISYMKEEVVTNGLQLHKVMELCRKTNESMENNQKDMQKLQNNGNESATGRKRSKEKQKVDPLCRDTFRKSYKSLKKEENFQGFDFKRSFDLAENEEVLKKVKDKMSDNNGSCKWTDEQIKIVGRRYFVSLNETDKKKSDNKYDDHKINSRRQNRKKQKLKRRRETLDKIDWVRREKVKATEVLTEEYMSSEVSESGEESLSGDEGCSKEKKLYIKTVPWESEDLKTLKSKLDEQYASCQTSRSRRREFQRERRPKDVSSRPKPNNGPSWAFRKDDGQ